jgi:tripartite-type tricarboxylate transporter receptor subunit TctC
MRKRCLGLTLIVSLSLLFIGHAPRAWAQTDTFYKGKTVRIVVGSTAGGFYDRWARLFAKYMGKYIPGNPEFIVQNMPGAGSVIAANNVYNVAKPDGLSLVMPLNGVYIDQLTGRPEAKFDMRKFEWIGSPAVESFIMYMRADTPYKSIDDMIKAKVPAKCGATGTASSDYVLARVLEMALGMKIETVLGYPGGTEIDLAVERNEVVCRTHSLSAHFGREPFDTWHKNNFDRHIVQTGNKRDPRAPDTPTVDEVLARYKVPADTRRLATILTAAGEFGRPMMATPGTPKDRVRLLRNALLKTLKDPGAVDEARRGRMDIEPTTGEDLEKLVREIFDAPPEVIARARKVLGS